MSDSSNATLAGALAMAQVKIPSTNLHKLNPRKRRTASIAESSLVRIRIRELDREFARQTKQLTALTKKFGKKIIKRKPDVNKES
jgi:hypothetical protein